MRNTTPGSAAALVAMPWTMFNRPSIQLGALKAYAESSSSHHVDCFHPYLNIARTIGIDNYHQLAASGWAGEALFSALLFPDHAAAAERLFHSTTDRRKLDKSWQELLSLIRETCTDWLESIDWQEYLAVGFSLCFYQVLPSLYMAAELKKIAGTPPILFGGSSCGGELGTSLLDTFAQIDFIIDGEGEAPFVELLDLLSSPSAPFPERVLCRKSRQAARSTPEINTLSSLPVPDFKPYFSQIESLFADTPFIPEIPIEFSRGCWWNKCTFCNLNLQWRGYRWKNAEKMLEELKHQASLHKVLDFCFTDNALPPKEADTFFQCLAHASVDLRFFAEIRATTEKAKLKTYSDAGLKTIQVGIESFSPTLLDKMAKGTSVMDNIAIMRHAMEAGIQLEGNLIVEFPGSAEQEVAQTLEALEFAEPFRPLSTASFFLGYGSPVHSCPEDYGIRGRTHHIRNKMLYPKTTLDRLQLLAMEYRGDRTLQRKLWKPVRERVEQWTEFHQQRTDDSLAPLSYRDGGSFLIIRQERAAGGVQRHRMTGTSREIYLFCTTVRTMQELHERFPSFKPEILESFISELCRKKLMFREAENVLALAIHGK